MGVAVDGLVCSMLGVRACLVDGGCWVGGFDLYPKEKTKGVSGKLSLKEDIHGSILNPHWIEGETPVKPPGCDCKAFPIDNCIETLPAGGRCCTAGLHNKNIIPN